MLENIRNLVNIKNMEVEIKAKIKDLNDVLSKLKRLNASIAPSKKQTDCYFQQKDHEMGTYRIGDFIVRIRDCEKGKFLTYKEITKRKGVWKEYEVSIDNLEEMESILKSIGLIEVFKINKERISGNVGKFSFNVDDVKELGKFIEVELIEDDGEKAQEEIKDFYKKLGISENQLERRGYGELWQDKHGGGTKYDEQK